MKGIILYISILSCLLCGCGLKISTQDKVINYMNKAEDLYKAKKEEESDLMIEKAIQLAEQEYGNKSKEVAKILLDSVDYATEFTTTQKRIERAEKIYEEFKDMEGIAKANYCYGELYARVGGKEKANEYYEQAIKYCDEVEGNVDELRYDIYVSWGLNENYTSEGLTLFKKAEDIFEKLSVERQNEVKVLLYANLGHCYYRLDEYQNAIKCYDIVIDSYKEMNRIVAECYHYRGFSYSGSGNYQKAIEDISKSITFLNDLEDASLWDRGTAYVHLSAIYTVNEVQNYDKVFEYGLEACRIYNEKSELSVTELKQLKTLKDFLEELYEKSPMAKQQDFELWYEENID